MRSLFIIALNSSDPWAQCNNPFIFLSNWRACSQVSGWLKLWWWWSRIHQEDFWSPLPRNSEGLDWALSIGQKGFCACFSLDPTLNSQRTAKCQEPLTQHSVSFQEISVLGKFPGKGLKIDEFKCCKLCKGSLISSMSFLSALTSQLIIKVGDWCLTHTNHRRFLTLMTRDLPTKSQNFKERKCHTT